MNLNLLAVKSMADDVILKAQQTSEIETRALELVNMSKELHKLSVELRLQAKELLAVISRK